MLCCSLFAVDGAAGLPPPANLRLLSGQVSSTREAFLEGLQRDTFAFFWETTNPRNGLTPDRFPADGYASIAGVGFALTAYIVGAERGYITRAEAAERTLATLKFFWAAPQGAGPAGVAGYKGFFYHFLDKQTGLRLGGSELSTIDTALLLAGVLSSQAYFTGGSQAEREIRGYAEALYGRVEWTWICSGRSPPLLGMGWKPESGFLGHDWRGYNEAMILYILALGSPTHAIDPRAWEAWTSTYRWDTFQGYPHVNFGPLFGHQYSHVWIDFRGIQDRYMRSKGIDYFENSRRATWANRAYCLDNPRGWSGYGGLLWGLTASDGPDVRRAGESGFQGYWARGCSAGYLCDDGTLAPTAVGGSVAFAPEITIPTLEYMRSRFGPDLYGSYGFKDAFNLSCRSAASPGGWFDDQYLAIDQGPILLMIENHRTGLVWDLLKRNAHVRNGLRRAGFTGGWLDGGAPAAGGPPAALEKTVSWSPAGT